MARKTTTLIGVCIAAAVFSPASVLDAAEWPNLPASATEGATVWDPGPQWPSIPAGGSREPRTEPATDVPPGRLNEAPWKLESRWPSIHSDWADEPTGSIGGPRWPSPQPISPFSLEIAARYWYSTGHTKFGFTNGEPLFGNPTSTLDWNDTPGHAGEIFARLDHRPTGVFMKGVLGAGVLKGGSIIDRDFFVYQIEFSDTTSDIKGNNFRYGIIDAGWAFEVPKAGVRLGAFAGYHWWHEKMTAYGDICNPDDIGGAFCGAPGTVVVATNIPVLEYEPTWHAVRLGFDTRVQFMPNWSLSAEFAAIPYARLVNNDSHLLRVDLGPSPNVISRSVSGYGAEAELFINYALTPNLEIGVGGRYWALLTDRGHVEFGPSFSTDFALTKFDQQRYGVVAQVKGTF